MAVRRTRKNRVSKKYQNKQNLKKTLRKRAKHNRSSNKPCLYGHIYSTTCGHCIAMDEEWKKLSRKVKDIELKDIGENYEENVESINREFQTNLTFEGVPTIFKLINHGLPMQYYTGERSAKLMKEWLYSK